MLIDCDTCAVRDLHCGDCVVSVFLTLPRAVPAPPAERPGRPGRPGRPNRSGHPAPVELDDTETDALSSLVAAGLVPPLRLVALPAPPDPERGIA